MNALAAIVGKAGAPLTVEAADLADPEDGELLAGFKAAGVRHVSHQPQSATGPHGIFPAILARGGAGVLAEVSPGARSLPAGTSGCGHGRYFFSFFMEDHLQFRQRALHG